MDTKLVLFLLLLPSASADYASCVASGKHLLFGQYCYRDFAISPNTYEVAKQQCRNHGGQLAVLINDHLRHAIAIVMDTAHRAYVALEQLSTDGQRSIDGWRWIVNGVVVTEAPAGSNLTRWGDVAPDDGSGVVGSAQQLDGGVQQFGAFRASSQLLGDFTADGDTRVTRALCQFRAASAKYVLYATGHRLEIGGKTNARSLGGVVNEETCAYECSVDPSCFAVTYSHPTANCWLYFDRPQDYSDSSLQPDADCNVWVVE